VTLHRPIRIDLQLPELTPAQAHSLWNFLDDLASELWLAYEPELLAVEDEPSPQPEPDNDWTDTDDLVEDGSPSPVSNDETDPDF